LAQYARAALIQPTRIRISCDSRHICIVTLARALSYHPVMVTKKTRRKTYAEVKRAFRRHMAAMVMVAELMDHATKLRKAGRIADARALEREIVSAVTVKGLK
jgi:hypothetical protein